MKFSKRVLPVLVSSVIGMGLAACGDSKQSGDSANAAPVLESDAQKGGYALGSYAGRQFLQQGFEVDVEALLAGIRDGYTNADLKMDEEQLVASMQALREAAMAKEQSEREEAAAASLKEGQDFLAANATKEGVVTTESGLQYKILTAGDGAVPQASDLVTVHYRGTLIDGTEFDSSIKRGQPATFPVNGVIPGWVEALQLMPVGSKWELYIPSDLAYGPGGAGQMIGPNSTLVFEVELLSIGEPTEEPAADATEE